MRVLFTLTLFVSSALLFLVEPMLGKMILPKFGGSPAVWNTSIVFFQAMLLLGYGYAHLSVKWLGVGRQSKLHLLLLTVAVTMIPFAISKAYAPNPGFSPALQLLWLLTTKVGVVFFAISAGAPLIQLWFANTKDPAAKDPYFLYSASNLGSLLALLAYPFVVEPLLALKDQSLLWSMAFAGLLILMALCAMVIWRAPKTIETTQEDTTPALPLTSRIRLKWVLLAFAPSSLLLGVTTFVTSNLAPIPLLWIVPLSLYLITFILAFSKLKVQPHKLGRWLSFAVIPLALVMLIEATEPLPVLGVLHLLAFFLAAWMCHLELAKSRPSTSHLTEFYMWISVGGVLGGCFNTLVSPSLFNSLLEYPAAIILACVLRPRTERDSFSWRDVAYPATVGALMLGLALATNAMAMGKGIERSAIAVAVPLFLSFLALERRVRFGLSLAALFGVANFLNLGPQGRIVDRARSFFGVHRVVTEGHFHQLFHGSTLHGEQNTLPQYRDEPLMYFSRTSPIGQVFREFSGPKMKPRVAIVGLGVGAMASYGEPGQRITYYEIDPEVVRIASDPKEFTFLQDSKAKVDVVLGDARLMIAKAAPASYDFIILDAFSSDAIPVHLLTQDATAGYLEKLAPHGLLAFHISNRYLDLEEVLHSVAASLHLSCLFQEDDSENPNPELPKAHSRWMLMARDPADFGSLSGAKLWHRLSLQSNSKPWTDDYSNLAGAIFKS